MNNTTPQLPMAVVNEIKIESQQYAKGLTFNSAWATPELIDELKTNAAEDWGAAATAYAKKLQVLEYDNNQLKGELEGYKKACEELQRQNDKMKAMATGWRPLLEDVLKHDAAFGELSIEMIEKIKKFLYGEE